MFDALWNLGNDVDGLFLLKDTFSRHVLLQIAHWTVFSDYIALGGCLIDIVAFHDVLMIETPEDVDFSFEHLQTWSAELLNVQYLDGDLLGVFERYSFVHFATVSWANLFLEINPIMTDSVWVVIKGIGNGVGDHGCDGAIGSQTLFRFGFRGKSILLGLGKIIGGEIALTHLSFIIKSIPSIAKLTC